MKHMPIALMFLALTACKEDVALPAALDLTYEAVGYYCQMELLDHEGPKGPAHLDGMPAPLFFSQVRDAVAYMLMPEQSHAILVTYVQDMTDAPDWAAPEFVPFSDPNAAAAFAAARGGMCCDLTRSHRR